MVRQDFYDALWHDADEKPAGGVSSGRGFTISWQNGPVDREPNGAFVIDIIESAVRRLSFYQESEFACEENQQAINLLNRAIDILDTRVTHKGN